MTHHRFPAEFRAVVWQLVRGQHSPTSVLRTLPMDVLELVVWHLAHSAMVAAPTVPAAVPTQGGSRCDAVLQ
jgi:hypothetical protein